MLARTDSHWEAAFRPSRATRAARLRWEALCDELRPTETVCGLEQALRMAGSLLLPVLHAFRENEDFPGVWSPTTGPSWTGPTPSGRGNPPRQLAWGELFGRGQQREVASAF